jgi:hypothetical protein
MGALSRQEQDRSWGALPYQAHRTDEGWHSLSLILPPDEAYNLACADPGSLSHRSGINRCELARFDPGSTDRHGSGPTRDDEITFRLSQGDHAITPAKHA